jgi:glutamine amidotransferase
MSRIAIIDYGLNNLKSVRKAFEQIDREVNVVSEGTSLSQPEALVLPGIGTYADGMEELRERSFVEPIREHVNAGCPLLGICLGMQLLFSASHELGYHEGLKLVPGKVVPFEPPEDVDVEGYKVPQVGWNEIRPYAGDDRDWNGTMLESFQSPIDVYFVHSLYPAPEKAKDIVAVGEYGNQTFTAVVQHENVVGTQFHPEKSGQAGGEMSGAFCEQFDV